MRQELSTDRLLQELQLMTEYLTAIKDPDPTFLRIHAELLLAHVDEVHPKRRMPIAA